MECNYIIALQPGKVVFHGYNDESRYVESRYCRKKAIAYYMENHSGIRELILRCNDHLNYLDGRHLHKITEDEAKTFETINS